DFKITTSGARRILPSQIMRLAAVKNCANACAITAAFASGNYRDLRGAFTDHLHQPYRQKLIPFLPRVIGAAEKAGALGALLSFVSTFTGNGFSVSGRLVVSLSASGTTPLAARARPRSSKNLRVPCRRVAGALPS